MNTIWGKSGSTWTNLSAPGYSASSCGMIQNLSGRWTRGGESDNYMVVKVHRKRKRVHRLVAEAFLGVPSSDDIIVNHINGFKQLTTWNTVHQVKIHSTQ